MRSFVAALAFLASASAFTPTLRSYNPARNLAAVSATRQHAKSPTTPSMLGVTFNSTLFHVALGGTEPPRPSCILDRDVHLLSGTGYESCCDGIALVRTENPAKYQRPFRVRRTCWTDKQRQQCEDWHEVGDEARRHQPRSRQQLLLRLS